MLYVWRNNDTYLPHSDLVLQYGKTYDITSIKGHVGDMFMIKDPETGEEAHMRYPTLSKFRRDWRAV